MIGLQQIEKGRLSTDNLMITGCSSPLRPSEMPVQNARQYNWRQGLFILQMRKSKISAPRRQHEPSRDLLRENRVAVSGEP